MMLYFRAKLLIQTHFSSLFKLATLSSGNKRSMNNTYVQYDQNML